MYENNWVRKNYAKKIYAKIAWGLDHQNGLDFNYAEITRGS